MVKHNQKIRWQFLPSRACFYKSPTSKVLLARLFRLWVDLYITTTAWKVSVFGAFRVLFTQYTQKWSFPLRIFLVDVHKSEENCGFIHIY